MKPPASRAASAEEASPAAPAGALIDRARAVTQRAIALRAEKVALAAEVRRTRAMTFEAQAREAATRTTLTDALLASLGSKAEALARTRADLADTYFPTPKPPWRGRVRLFRLLDRVGYLRRGLPPLFDEGFYAARHAQELRAAGLSPVAHFMAVGAARGLDPHPLFDVRRYAAQGPKLRRGENLVSHYIREGWRFGLSPHPLFDPAWYVAQADIGADTAPLIHYLEHGWRAGLSPHPLFDAAWYLETNPDVAESGVEPLSHFIAHGAREGRSPSPWFDIAFYAEARGEALPTDGNPLVDYLDGGAWAVAAPAPGMATAAYLAAHPELAAEGLTPLEHWIRRHAV